MSAVVWPTQGPPVAAPRGHDDAGARPGDGDGRREDPFGTSLRSALEGPDHRSAPPGSERVRSEPGPDRGRRAEHGGRPPQVRSGQRPEDAARPDGPRPEEPVAEDDAGRAGGDGERPSEDGDGAAHADGPGHPPPPTALEPVRPVTPASVDPPGLDPLHTPRPVTPASVDPPGLDPLRPATPGSTRSSPVDGAATEGSVPGTGPAQPSPTGAPAATPTPVTGVDPPATASAGPPVPSATGDSDGAGAPADTATRTAAPNPELDGVPLPDTAEGPPTSVHTGTTDAPEDAPPRPGAADGAGIPVAHHQPGRTDAAPAPTPTPGVEGTERLVRLSELVDAARATMRRSGPSRVRVQLHPAELGGVEVEVRLRDGGVHLVLRAEHPHGAERLASNLAELRRGLEREGLQLHDLEVSLGGGDAGRRGDPDLTDAGEEVARRDPVGAGRPGAPSTASPRPSAVHRSDGRLTIEL